MNWKLSALAGVFVLMLAGCTLRIAAKAWKTYAPVTADADFVLFESTDTLPETGVESLGKIVIDQKNLDYQAILDTAASIARRWGGNALKINRHRQSLDLWLGRPHHEVEATALRLSDLSAHLKILAWNERRPLQVADFQGDTTGQPYIAVTSSSISLYWEIHPAQKRAIVQTRAVFTRPMSYFKYRPDSLDILAHEQGHFDIAEIYARKFRQCLVEYPFTAKSLNTEIRKIYEANFQAMQAFQDRYDHDIYADPRKQGGWLANIKSELARYSAYRQDKWVINLKN